MLNPLYLLAALSVFGGFLGYWFGGTSLLEGLLSRAGIPAPHAEPFSELIASPLTWIAVSGSILGICSALFLFARLSRRDLSFPLFKRAFFVDEVYEMLIVLPLRALSRFIGGGLEPKVFDGSLALAAAGVDKTSRALRKIQSGQIRSYAALLVLGSALLIVYLVY
jgi:NADH-quinone oxidoreductase subunit L